jgi:hypothetical protein
MRTAGDAKGVGDMPPVSLPDDASLEQLRKQAKDVRDLARAGVPGALDLVAEYHPKGAHPVTPVIDNSAERAESAGSMWREAYRCRSQEVAERGRSVTIRHVAAGEGVLSASPGFWLGSRIGWRRACLGNDLPAGARADVAPARPLVRWIALRQQGDRTSAALSGGGAIP